MLSYPVYKLFHLLGIFMTFVSLGGVLLYVLNNGTKVDNRCRKTVAITHGIGLFLVLLGGFGMLARLQIHWPWPGWVIVKSIIWVALGGFNVVVYRLGSRGQALWYILILLGVLAAYMAVMKPI